MANSKQITELIAATGVNSTDQLPLAQSGNSEAVRATVQQLAEAVGELNETGALRELELATSLGKNLLAQNLNEKGVEASPSETLISLADKVGGLEIDSNKETLIGGITVSDEYNTYDTNTGYGKAFSICLLNGYTAMISHNRLYFCDTYGEYTGMEDFVNRAHSSIELEETGINVNLSISPNGRYLTMNSTSSSSYIYIYAVDYENKTFSLYKTVELTLNHNGGVSCCNNDASVVAYTTGSSSSVYVTIASTADTSIYTTVNPRGSSSSYMDSYPRICFDNSLDYVYYFNGTYQGNTRAFYARISFTLNESSISASLLSNNGIYSNHHGPVNLNPFTSILLNKPIFQEPVKYQEYTTYIQAIDLKTNTASNTLAIPLNINWVDTTLYNSLHYMIVPLGFCNCPVTQSGNTYRYHMSLPYGYLVYDKITNTLSYEYDNTGATIPYISNFSYSSAYNENQYYFTASNFFDTKKRYIFTHSPIGVNRLKRISYRREQVYGYQRTKNDVTTRYTQEVFPIASINRGDYDAGTQIIELEEESN